MRIAIALVLIAAGWRILALFQPALNNFAPLMALAFCGGVYFRNRWLWLIPFAALSLSDLYIDHFYAEQFGYEWTTRGLLMRTLCFGAALYLGHLVSQRRSWMNLLSGALAGSLIFYFATNTASWVGDIAYARSFAGWWQAMTIGHPEFPPTLLFFRNTLISDLVFTGLFAVTMELAERRAGRPSLLRPGQLATASSASRRPSTSDGPTIS